MKQAIDWIKANLAIVISGAVGVISVALIVLGVLSGEAAEKMQQDASLLQSLQGLQPVNSQVIESAKQAQARQRRELQRLMRQLDKSEEYEPLHPNVFPEIPPAQRTSAPFQFRNNYIQKQRELLDVLNAKEKPTAQELRGVRAVGTGRAGPVNRSGRDRRGSAESTARAVPKESYEAKLLLKHAHDIYCYAGRENLDQRPNITESGERPTLENMWRAQVAMWVQQDVIQALANVNNNAAQQVAEPWVGNLPVKHLMTLGVEDSYISEEGASRGSSVKLPSEFFVSHDDIRNVDLLHFRIHLIVEADALLDVIAEISKAGFYTLLQPQITAVTADHPNLREGYKYGSEPMVEADLVFEACFLQEGNYAELKPDEIKQSSGGGRSRGRRRY